MILRNPFYKMIENLLLTNTLVLYGQINEITVEQEKEVLEFLESYYQKESINYPNTPPAFDKEAAAWSSKILFYAAQLVMYREHTGDTLSVFFPTYELPKTAATIITADLSLRYLPSILKYLEQIDKEDALIPILKKILIEWEYSGLLSDVEVEVQDAELFLTYRCLNELYINRVIENKKIKIAQHEKIRPLVLSALGNYTNEFWKEFNSPI